MSQLNLQEEVVGAFIQDVTVSTVVDLEAYKVVIQEEALYNTTSDETYNVEITDDVFKETFNETIERIVVNNRFDLDVLNKAEQKEIINDSPSTGDITIYYGIAAPFSLTSDPVWLITRTIYLSPDFTSTKKFASALFDKVWDDYLTYTYQ